MAIDLTMAGIAAAVGPPKAGRYEARVAKVTTSALLGGGRNCNLALEVRAR